MAADSANSDIDSKITEEDVKHDYIAPEYRAKSRTNVNTNSVKSANNIALKKILDSKPTILTGTNLEQPGSEIISEIFANIYFDGSWNRASYAIDNRDEEAFAEHKTKKDCQLQFYRPLTVFGDDEMFEYIASERKQNREQCTFYSELKFINTPYPLPSQRLKRLLYPFKSFKHIEQQNPNFAQQLEQVNNDEQEYYLRVRNKAKLLQKLYSAVTQYQTNDGTNSAIQTQKQQFWYKQRHELEEQNVGNYSEHNIPPWITDGWYGQSALAHNRNLRMPQYKTKTFKAFYPKTARWDRIIRGCYELDWGDEDHVMDIIRYDKELHKTPLEVILSLRRCRLFDENENKEKWTEFKPFARDPFVHIYGFYNIAHQTLELDGGQNVYARIRSLYWTLHCLWFVGSRFDYDGCLRVPALINPIEWQYALGLKLIWDGIRVIGNIGKLHACSVKHCNTQDAGNKTMQFLKKVTYAFDFNEGQIYDFRYLLYLLRHTLYNQLLHCLCKHGGRYQLKVFAKQKKEVKYGIEMAHDEEYRFVLDYFRFLVLSNNMYEFFSPAAMGKLWQWICGTFEELRMIYPEISLTTIENEYQDLMETHRHLSVTKTMTAKSYSYYFGNKIFTNKGNNIWQDARGVIKQYCIKNTLFPVPDIFESVYASHSIRNEANPCLVDVKHLSESDNQKYKKEKLKKFISNFVMNMLENPIAFYLTEIKYPFLCNLIRACIKYELFEFAQLLLNHSITSALIKYGKNSHNISAQTKNRLEQSKEYEHFSKAQQQSAATGFTWPHILFVEYLSFNPREFHRQHLCHIIEETNHFKQCIRNEKQSNTNKSQRKILSYSNRIKLQKQKFDAWQKASEHNRIPYYPLAVLLRFAICERTDAQIDADDELKQEGKDFTITKSVITALQTILRYPQFSTRILMNTYNPHLLINEVAYHEFKGIYQAIFRYNSKYQEHPQMYETFKKKWMEYAKQVKALLSVYHEPHHRLHREVSCVSFYEWHKSHVGEKLFGYHAHTHMQQMFDKHKLDISMQEQSVTNDVQIMFKLFGYSDDSEHRFYGNYYRVFVEKEDKSDANDSLVDTSTASSNYDSNESESESESESEQSNESNESHDEDESNESKEERHKISEIEPDMEMEIEIEPELSENSKQSKARGSNEYSADDIQQITKKRNESPLLTNISEEENISEENVLSNPFQHGKGNGIDDFEDFDSDDAIHNEEKKEETNMSEEDGLGDIDTSMAKRKKKSHQKQGSDMIADIAEQMAMENRNVEEEQQHLLQHSSKYNTQTNLTDDSSDNYNEFKVNVGNTVRHMKKEFSRRDAMLANDGQESDGDNGDGDGNGNEQPQQHTSDSSHDSSSDSGDDADFHASKNWANTLLNNPNIVGMQSRDAMLQRKEEQQDLYRRHQIIRLKEDEQENLYSILDLENTEFIDSIMFNEMEIDRLNELVPDVLAKKEEEEDLTEQVQVQEELNMGTEAFIDEVFFNVRESNRWKGKANKIVSAEMSENSYVMLRDLTEPLSLSELLGDFQKAGQIMLSRIDDMQASLIVENKLHSSVLKAHQTNEKGLFVEREDLLTNIEKLELELKLLRDKRDENKSETAALKTKQESYILKYNELKEVSTQKLRDQLRCFEIYKSQCTQLEKRISDVSYQSEIGHKRQSRLVHFKRQQQLNIAHLDIEIESMEKEKQSSAEELLKLESEQLSIDENEKVYVLRLKEQLRRLGKGMENKEKSCNIFRRNVVEERLRIHTIDDSLKKLRTNANPTTSSDQELINATQHEALQAREKYAETTHQHSFLTNIHKHEKRLIECIEKVQRIDDDIYAKKWNIIQKSWNLKKHLIETGKLVQMKKYLLKKEKNSKKHKKKLSKSHFIKSNIKNLSYGASQQFKRQSQDFGAY